MKYFEEVKIGDKVWDWILGLGKVIGLVNMGFGVKFKTCEKYYHYNGEPYYDDNMGLGNRRLFYYNDRPIVLKWNEELSKKYGNDRNKFIKDFSKWI